MNACHGHYWCHTCDEPPQSSCHRSKHHRVEFILGEPIRDVTVLAQKHRVQHTHQFTPANTRLEPDKAHELFEQIRQKLTN